MTDLLEKLYYDPLTGFTSFDVLYRKAKAEGSALTRKQIKEWYDRQSISRTTKTPKIIRSRFIPIRCPNGIGCLVADLVDMRQFASRNRHYNWMLNIIDMSSRYAWSFPLKNKQPSTLLPHVKSVIESDFLLGKQISMTTDSGNEFRGSLKRYLDKKDINLNQTVNQYNTMHVESFNRTILARFRRYWKANNTVEWVKPLQKMVENYNRSFHQSIKAKPYDVIRDLNKSKEPKRVVHDPFKVGDYVRYQLSLDRFAKRTRQTRYSDVYQIVWRSGARYHLYDRQKQEVLERKFLPRELLMASNQEVDQNKSEMHEIFEQITERLQNDERFNRRQREVEIPHRLEPQKGKRKRVPKRNFELLV